MSIVLHLEIWWILVCTFGGWYGRGSFPQNFIWGAPGVWLLMVILGIILINMLVPAGHLGRY